MSEKAETPSSQNDRRVDCWFKKIQTVEGQQTPIVGTKTIDDVHAEQRVAR